ncbi:sensor domain-containing phosphodiesterase [Kineococcus sp. NBC_00420]|uniref:putative bifunctional diguanylate cyclase/phosphodiesterase n=1 Tax=Kineococcus sp. NBC_00420 TaxID=2903564 RepID=UPI002E244FBD
MIDIGALHAQVIHLAALAHTDFDAVAVLTKLCDAARSTMEVDGVGVMASDGVRTRFVDTDHPDLLALERLQETVQQGPCREAVNTGAAVLVSDLSANDLPQRWPAFTEAARSAGMGSVLAVPLLARGRAWGTLDLYRRRSGVWSTQDLAAAALLAEVAVSYLALAADRDAARVVQAELVARNLHDDLTGLPNRTLFTDRLEQALLAGHRHASAVAVLFIDLDRFKAVNDTFGHAGGDLVLIEVARRMEAVMREGDTLARLAGDEFVIVCVDLPLLAPGVLDNVLAGVTNRLRCALSPTMRVEDVDLVVSASIGVAVTGAGLGSEHVLAADLLREADAAMYLAKAGGRDRVHLTSFDGIHGDSNCQGASCQERSCTWGRDLGRDLAHALDRGEFRVHYQPIVETGTRRVHAVEALLRWEHPRYGLLRPVDFLQLAIHSGRLPGIGHWVLAQACADLAAWRAQVADAPDRVFCNLSAVELADPHLSAVIAAALQVNGLHPGDLGLEVVEDDFAGPDLAPALRVLHEAGHPLSIDDFGTGYSSLSRLVTLPVAIAKIDKAFIAGLAQDPRSRALVDAVMVVAHSLGLQVIAEGVETPEQAAQVLACGCEYLQGHQESAPLTAEAVLRWLQRTPRLPVDEPGR